MDNVRKFEQTKLTYTIVKALKRALTLTKDGSNRMHLEEYMEFQKLLHLI